MQSQSRRADEFAPLSVVPGWRFDQAIEVDVAPGESLDETWIARIEGEHPIFGFRRGFLFPYWVGAVDDRRVMRFRYPPAGLYELKRTSRDTKQIQYVLFDEWRRCFPMTYDVLEMIAPILESLRETKSRTRRTGVAKPSL